MGGTMRRVLEVGRFAAVVGLCLGVIALGARARSAGPASPEERWGIRPLWVRAVAGGYMVHFRYRVVDSDRAKALFDKAVKPTVIDRKSGAALAMPTDTKLGALRSSPRTRPENGKEYFVLFNNSAKAVKPGSHVDVLLGGCRLNDLVVQ